MSERCFKVGKMRWPALVFALAVVSTHVFGDSLDHDIDALAREVSDLSQTLYGVEDAMLFPADTRVAVYLSVADRDSFVLDSVELSINGQPAVSHLYTDRERQALAQGAIQQLYMGNLPAGQHSLTATLNGQAANDHYVRQQHRFTLRKRAGETRVQLVVEAGPQGQQPDFALREWQ